MKKENKDEQIKISFLGFQLECNNPTSKAIIIITLCLMLFAVVVVFLPKLSLVKLFSG